MSPQSTAVQDEVAVETDDVKPIRFGVLVGSPRPSRRSPAIAEWVMSDESIPRESIDQIDIAELELPMLQEPLAAVFGRYDAPATKAWSERIAALDAFIIVTPEYNASIPAALKNALDHLYGEWSRKPVAFVAYGMAGGIRAAEHLRLISAELGMAALPQSVHLNAAQTRHGVFEESAADRAALAETLSELVRWAHAFRSIRQAAES